jgi:DNA-binding transcriptional regulator YhcF (GntR family)
MGEKSVIQIDLASPVPAYRQIADAIRQLLVNRELLPGQQLPTVRQLAIDLTVHHNTVAEAYRLLSEEGWLDLKRRRGARVLARATPNTTARERGALRRRLGGLVAEMRTAGLPVDAIRAEFDLIARRLATGRGK